MQWTSDQQQVIDKRDDNILVSASAGSGKTAVLVARILAYITDAIQPVDIDRLLIVTFTKAAAGEMRERIGKAISDALLGDPDNEHLQRQASLIHNAQITTIDGFCSYIVRAYCHTIDLEPGFRVADEGEVKLLRADVLKEILEELHGQEDPAKKQKFEDFVESFATGKTDRAVEDVILKLFDASESQPWPFKWLEECRSDNAAGSFEEMSRTGWMKSYMRDADLLISDGLSLTEKNMELCDRPDGPSAYFPAAEADRRFFAELSELAGYGERHEYMHTDFAGKMVKLSAKRPSAGEDPALRELFKANRAESKKIREELQNEIYVYAPDEVLRAMQSNEPILNTLIDVTNLFRDRYAQKKRERKIVDFADLEHFTLRILRKEDGSRTEPAKELARRFREVMCDEYQDSNYLQEAILTAVSRIEDGQNNYFCVGDVKQSIYGFRHARPDLFMKKFHDYAREGDEKPDREAEAWKSTHLPHLTGTRIDLRKNFRSRHEVLDIVNGIFRQVMISGVGGVDYDDDASLVCGAGYPEADHGEFYTEVLMAMTHEEDSSGEYLLDDRSSAAGRELEARMIADRISNLVRHEEIYDTNSGRMRKVEYRDIVILLRSMRGWADTFVNILEQQGIPAYSTAKSGYFSALEVMTILNYLAIVDNPEQDIPYTSILRSPIVGLTAEELAKVRCACGSPADNKDARYLSMAECTRRYAAGQADDTESSLRDKLTEFLDVYNAVRNSVSYTPIHELIWTILTGTGYLDYVSALPGGAQRSANLRMLTEKAIAYEETSYVGLFNFIRYINNLQKYDVDAGEVSVLGENENVVRIVSIHKSKGLEYPVVFAAGNSKAFNRRDLNASLLIDQEYGLAADYVDFNARVRIPTIKKTAVRKKILRENSGEEMRVLYVALTRAKQKLILTGTIKDEESWEKIKNMQAPLREVPFPENYLLKSSNPNVFLIPAIDRMIARAKAEGIPCPVNIILVSPADLVREELVEQSRFDESLHILGNADGSIVFDPEIRKTIDERFSYVYPWQGRENVPAKVSVSELKHGQFVDEDAEERFPEPEIVPYIPQFVNDKTETTMSGNDENAATIRGTAYHRIMELLDYGRTTEILKGTEGDEREKDILIQELTEQIDGFTASKRMLREEADLVNVRDIGIFVRSSLGKRMAAAFAQNKLYREQPFTLGVGASEINPEYPDEEQILVQGIIDAFFYEGESIVLVDYKTDRVSRLDELKKRYQVQLDSYEEALSRVTGYPVSQKIIWSFAKGTELIL